MSPVVTPDPTGMKEWWQLYEAHYDELLRTMLDHASGMPGMRSLMERMGPRQLEAQQKAARETLKSAIDGNWDPTFASWRSQGPTFAALDVPFSEWFELIGATQRLLIPHVVRAYASEPDRLSRALVALAAYIDLAMAGIGDAYLAAKERIILQQQQAIQELSTPVLQVRDQLLLIPIVGMLDTFRARQVTEALLHAVREHRAKVVVIDITGVAAVDSKVANHLFQTVAAAKLMGATSIITGLSAEVAQALVVLGVDVHRLNTAGDLQGGLEQANALLGTRVVPGPRPERRPAPRGPSVAEWSNGHGGTDPQAG
jgi:rsbT co-antagonist protein RsbR